MAAAFLTLGYASFYYASSFTGYHIVKHKMQEAADNTRSLLTKSYILTEQDFVFRNVG